MVYRTPKDVQERKDEKRRHILDTAAKVFARMGYHDTSVKDIVDEAGISVGSFYFYFKSKEDLFETLYDEMYQFLFGSIVHAGTAENPGESFARSVVALLMAFSERRELAKIMMVDAVGLNPRFEAKRVQVTKMFTDFSESCLRDMNSSCTLRVSDIEVAAVASVGAFYHCINHWLQSSQSMDIKRYAKTLVFYNLRAWGVGFDEGWLDQQIDKILTEGLTA